MFALPFSINSITIDLNFILTVLGLVVGVIGAYLTIHIYRKEKKGKLLSISHYTSFFVNSEKNKDIKILYKKKTIKKIICHIYRLKNRGNVCIFRADIPEKLPIRFISNEEFSIIGAQIWQETEFNIGLIPTDNSFSSFVVDFDYLNPNTYFDIHLYGFSENEDFSPTIQGDVIGGKFVDDGLLTETEDVNGIRNFLRFTKIVALACFIFAFLPDNFKTILLIIIASLNLIVFLFLGLVFKSRISDTSAYRKDKKES